MKSAVFLDRDGTLIKQAPYLCRPEQVVLSPGVASALKRLQDGGFQLIMVTNQSGVGRGLFSMETVDCVNAFVSNELSKEGVQIGPIYVAPEAPWQRRLGRKPSPLFLFQARDQEGIRLDQSYMVGDKLEDLQCGWNAGVRKSILVRTGYGANVESECQAELGRAVVLADLRAASDWILARKGRNEV